MNLLWCVVFFPFYAHSLTKSQLASILAAPRHVNFREFKAGYFFSPALLPILSMLFPRFLYVTRHRCFHVCHVLTADWIHHASPGSLFKRMHTLINYTGKKNIMLLKLVLCGTLILLQHIHIKMKKIILKTIVS